jgi:phosphopentomutase
MFYTALEYVKYAKPRVLFIGLGETDDWAHSASYAEYLNAAHRSDAYIGALWTLIQSMPEYKDKTTLVVLPDHGRGEGAKWTDHGKEIPESSQTWMAWLGPDTAALGERKNVAPVTESQVAATLAALLGEDYHAAVLKSGSPIPGVIPKP